MGTAEKPSEAPEDILPRQLGKYTLLRKLAVGGMAELFLALQRSVAGFEKLVVIKRILPKHAADESFVEMLLSEAAIIATLNHTNISHVYDVNWGDGEYYIAMEHIHGEDIRGIVRQMQKVGEGVFPLEHAIAIATGTCKGLAYAHERTNLDGTPLHIVHRDISPQNIVVTFEGEVKIVDFGIASSVLETQNEETTGSGQKVKGKIPYMSPEQVGGHVVDARSDIFSLGIILFELCTGQRLFRAKSEFEAMERIVKHEYPSPRSIHPDLDEELERIIVKALSRDVEGRYQTARELQADLEAYVRDSQLVVSQLSFGEWMKSLFAEKLAEQTQMLKEGRALAEIYAREEEEGRTSVTGSGVHARRESQPPSEPPKRTSAPPVDSSASEPSTALTEDGDAKASSLGAAVGGVTSSEAPPSSEGSASTPETVGAPVATAVEADEESSSKLIPMLLVAVVLAALAGAAFFFMRPSDEAPAEALVDVRVESDPGGASVIVDGNEHSALTPTSVSLPHGEHVIELRREGRQPHRETITVGSGPAPKIDAMLALDAPPPPDVVMVDPPGPASPGYLVLESVRPRDASIFIDGERRSGRVPLRIELMPGEHRVVVRRRGYKSHRELLQVGVNETLTRRVRLERGRDRPEDAEPAMPPAMMDPVAMSTMEPAMVEMVVPSGTPGRLSFDARPWCNVTIDGRAVGQTPIANRSLRPGPHTIRCVNPELNVSRSVNVTIRSGETTRRRLDLR